MTSKSKLMDMHHSYFVVKYNEYITNIVNGGCVGRTVAI